ncbi:MAG: hypothetical protein M3157_02935 [Actinomycetota bacterium]|nr:hypothetical protein [Actinomycetota bacterium]
MGERGPKELITEEAFEELEEAMKRGEIATITQTHRFLSERGVHYAHPESVGGLLRRRKVKLKRGDLGTRRPIPKSKRLSKKVRREGRREQRALRQTAEGFGLRRGSLWPHQLAQEAVLSQGLSPALRCEAGL